MFFCRSEFKGFVINKVFEKLNNVVGKFLVLYKIEKKDILLFL